MKATTGLYIFPERNLTISETISNKSAAILTRADLKKTADFIILAAYLAGCKYGDP